jgi:hypothetical protein
VDGVRIAGLRIQFRVEKSIRQEPSTLDLRVFNFSAAHRAGMQKKGAKVILEAGYADGLEIVFSGDARTVDHVRDSTPEWVTHIQCGDGERAYLYSRINQSFGPGTSVKQILSAMAQAMGVDLGNSASKISAAQLRGGLAQFQHGYVASGKTAAEFSRLLKTAGLTWSIQDGALQVLAGDADYANTTVPLISQGSGMVGSPDHGTPDKKGQASILKVKSFLQPSIRPGMRVQIKSNTANGLYRVEKLSHQGDSAGPEWYTILETRPL